MGNQSKNAMNARKQPIPPGLVAAEKSPLTAFLLEMSGHMMVSLARSLRHESMSLAEFASVSLLLPGKPLRINELADVLDHPLPATSRIVSSLVDRGLVERREDPGDRRAKVLTLTPAGRAMMDELSISLAGRVEESLAGMAGSVTETMRPVFASLRQAEGAPQPPRREDAPIQKLEQSSTSGKTGGPERTARRKKYDLI
jgi:DNA-binding MarR family transcriptional regulator